MSTKVSRPVLRGPGPSNGAWLLGIVSLQHLLGWMVSAFHSREDLVLKNLALRQPLLALHAQRSCRRLTALHKLFWVALKTLWSGWRKPLVLVTPRIGSALSISPFFFPARVRAYVTGVEDRGGL